MTGFQFGPPLTIVERVEIAQAALDALNERELVLGERDCVRLLALVVTAAGWPDPAKGLNYKTEAAAHRTLKRLGYADLAEAVDKRLGFTRIPLAWHQPGDIVFFPSDCGMGALGVAVGQGKALAFVGTSVDPRSLARIRRRLAGIEHRLVRAREACDRGEMSEAELAERCAGMEVRRQTLGALAAASAGTAVRAMAGSINVALICWRLEQCPR